MKKPHLPGMSSIFKQSLDDGYMSEEAFIPTCFCVRCNALQLIEIVESKTEKGEPKQSVLCMSCGEVLNFMADVKVKLYTPEEMMELGYDLFDILEQYEEIDRWQKIRSWAN